MVLYACLVIPLLVKPYIFIERGLSLPLLLLLLAVHVAAWWVMHVASGRGLHSATLHTRPGAGGTPSMRHPQATLVRDMQASTSSFGSQPQL